MLGEGISIWIGGLSKAGHHPQCGGCPPVLRAWLEHRAEVGGRGSGVGGQLMPASLPDLHEPEHAPFWTWTGINTIAFPGVWTLNHTSASLGFLDCGNSYFRKRNCVGQSLWEISCFAINRSITSESFLPHYLFFITMILFCDKNTM